MPISAQSTDVRLRDNLRELSLSLEDAFGEWISASTRIELAAAALAGPEAWAAWFAIPTQIIGSLGAIVDLISSSKSPIPIEWLQLQSETRASLQRMRRELGDWVDTLQTR